MNLKMNELSENSCLDLKEEYWTDNISEILKIRENEPCLRMTEAEEKREYAIMMQRRRDFYKKVEAVWESKYRHLNSLQKRVLKSEITKEMEDKETDFNIDYVDYIMDNK